MDREQRTRSAFRRSRLALMALGVFAVVFLSGRAPATGSPPTQLLDVAVTARKSLVRVSWIHRRRPQDAFERVGAVVRSDGLILVAGPVVEDGAHFTVRLPDGGLTPGRFVAADAETALTLLRVTRKLPKPLAGLVPPAPGTEALAPTADGSTVVLVHADGTVARGPLRAGLRYDRVRVRGRSVRTTALREAALGALAKDRGAPWMDARGVLVGLHYGRTLGVPREGEAQARARGLRLRREVVAAYAVPAAVARIVWPLLAEHGKVPRGALGVTTQAMDEAMRAQLCPNCGGHVVVALREDGAAAAAGLRRHDVIVGVGGVPVAVGATLQDALLPHRPGETVGLEVLRAGKRQRLAVTLR